MTRRGFAKYLSISAGACFLPSCAAPPGSKNSYLTAHINTDGEISPDAYMTDVMFQAIRDQGFGPPIAARVYAIGHLAGFLAVNAIEGCYESPYSSIGRAPAGISAKAAYAAALSRAIAEALQSTRPLDLGLYLKQLTDSPAAVEAGVRWGRYVGKIVGKERAIDGGHQEKVGFYFDPSYTPRKTIDSWSTTVPHYRTEIGPRFESYERGLFPNLGNMTPFAIRSKTQFSADPFPNVRSREFAEQFEEVYQYGGTNSSVRTKDQKEIAFFWEDGPRGGTVPASILHIAIGLFDKQRERWPLIKRAHLLAQMSCSMADGGMSAWHAKYHYDIFRPETAIRYTADKLENPDPRVKVDRKWTTLIPTPPFPTYVSGHSTFAASGGEALRIGFGTDHVKFEAEALDTVNWPKQIGGAKRYYTKISTMEDENGMSRIYGGVHWQHDNEQGLKMGHSIARYAAKNFLKRIA